MKTPIKNISEMKFELSVNSEQWRRVESFDFSGPNDQHYTLDRETGMISFGNGEHGQSPPPGSSIQATYRCGAGADGAVENGPVITLTWTSRSFRKNEVIWAIIESQIDGIIFRTCQESEVPHRWKWIAILCRKIKKWLIRLICRFS